MAAGGQCIERCIPLPFILLAVCLLCAACGGSEQLSAANPEPAAPEATAPPVGGQSGWPTSLPADALQPWERGVSALDADSEFEPGAQYWQAEGTATELDAALRLESGAPGSGGVSYATYRLWLAGGVPGVVSADVNTHLRGDSQPGTYYLGIANYGARSWEWHGPYTDSHVRLLLDDGAGYTSEAGSLFACVLVFDGSACDVVGVSATLADPADTTPPPQVEQPAVAACATGLEVSWSPVAAPDLAGYRVLWRAEPFLDEHSTGVRSRDYLEGTTRVLLPLEADNYVRVQALDRSGNAGPVSEPSAGTPLPGQAPPVSLTVSQPSALRHDPVTLTATGAAYYDWDLDGDGEFDVLDDETSAAEVDTSNTGIIRPRVRARGGADWVQLSAVSVLVSGNTRPVANAVVSPQSGHSPVTVSYSGEAWDAEDDAAELTYAWDTNGDGTYNSGTDWNSLTPPDGTYVTPGIYNVKFRVTDSDGVWDVDTAAVQVLDPANEPPVAAISASPASGVSGQSISFDGSGSTDPAPASGGGIVKYYWDFDDGSPVAVTFDPAIDHEYNSSGTFTVELTCEDTHGALGSATTAVTIANSAPVAALTVTPDVFNPPLEVRLDASGSTDADGNIEYYEWDFDGDGVVDMTTPDPVVHHYYEMPKYYDAAVNVVDAGGAGNTATAEVTVRGWFITMPTPGARGYYGVDGQEVNGRPALSFHNLEPSPSTLSYVRALDEYGFEWGEVVTDLDNTLSYSGFFTDLEIVDGNPAMLYMAQGPYIGYIRAEDADGTSWGTPVLADSGSNRATYGADMEVVDGRPAVAYYDNFSGDLMYNRASNTTGSVWPSAGTAIVTADDVGRHASMEIVQGRPAIAYFNNTGDDIYYIRAADATGSSWDAPVLVINGGVTDDFDMAVYRYSTNYYPAICYYNETDGEVRGVWGNSTNGSSWRSSYLIAAGMESGAYSFSTTYVGGYNSFAFCSQGDHKVKYVQGMFISQSDLPVQVGSDASRALSCQLFALNNKQAIVYYENWNQKLYYCYLVE